MFYILNSLLNALVLEVVDWCSCSAPTNLGVMSDQRRPVACDVLCCLVIVDEAKELWCSPLGSSK